jgi:translation initiation factor 2B subunit (eIF-2B alpha/beta/delta family)
MDSEQRLEALVAPLRADVVSGASVVAGLAAEVFRRAAIRVPVGSAEELRWTMGEVATRVLEAQPAMAPLVSLVRDVMDAVEGCDTVESGRHAAARAAEAFRAGLEVRSRQVAERASALIPEGGLIATISSSATVRAALLANGRDPGHRVLCLESRPMEEGKLLAKALAESRIPVMFAIDAAAHALASECDAVFLGADSIGDAGVVNKVGSAALAHAAKNADVPVYVLADETKILPPGFPQPLDDDRPGGEVWPAPAGVEVWNRYFETLPLEVVTSVITESDALTPEDLKHFRGTLQLPHGLSTWATGRARAVQDT